MFIDLSAIAREKEIEEKPYLYNQRVTNTLKRPELVQELKRIGYSIFYARGSVSYAVLVAHNDTASLFIIIRKNGIDFKYYSPAITPEFDEYGKLFVVGGKTIQHHYDLQGDNLHRRILHHAMIFIENGVLDEGFFSGYGRSWRERQPQKVRSGNWGSSGVISSEDGYIGDGLWCTGSGIEDLGR